MAGLFERGLRWVDRIALVHGLASTEFVRTYLLAALMTLATGGTGVLGGLPAMWIIMASAVVFGAVSQGMLRINQFREFKTPENKLRYNGTVFNFDLVPIPDNRKFRRATASVNRRVVPPKDAEPLIREIAIGQLGAEIVNHASFPISVIVASAESEIEGMTPPRTQYPKPAITLLPGTPLRITDEKISLNSLRCGRIEGKVNLFLKYGLPGKEHFKLDIKAKRVDILMHENGYYAGNHTEWDAN